MFKLIYKEKGKSSFQAINEFKRENKIEKIGHTGTLDPLAQGFLLIVTDDDTKLIPYIKNKDKEYRTIMKLGYISKTYDSEGPIEFKSDYVPSLDEIKNVLSVFIGKIKQTPPIFSAKKINGKRAYEYAREEKEINLKPIDVEIYNIDLIKYEYPYLEIKTNVSNGTYIRSLVNDIGNKLKTGAYITLLERTKINGLSQIQDININFLLDMNQFQIKSKDKLQSWFNGIIDEQINLTNGNYLIEFQKNYVGFFELKDKQIIKIKLFGKKIEKLLKG